MKTYLDKSSEQESGHIAGKNAVQLKDNRPRSVLQKKQVEDLSQKNTVQKKTNNDLHLPVQRQIIVNKAAMPWEQVFAEIVSPHIEAIVAGTGATVGQIKKVLKKYDEGDIDFPTGEKLIEILGQELTIEVLENGITPDEVSEEESDGKEEEPDSLVEVFESVVSTGNVFGIKEAEVDHATAVLLYRSVERGELMGLVESLMETGRPVFRHKASSKGRAEKFFAPNKAYAVESMGGKGKRSFLLEIVFDPAVRAFIHDPKNTGLDVSTVGTPGYEDLPMENQHAPKGITIKTETPKKKKGISYTSRNIGFRLDSGLLEKFSEFIIAINLVDHEYNIKNVKKDL